MAAKPHWLHEGVNKHEFDVEMLMLEAIMVRVVNILYLTLMNAIW